VKFASLSGVIPMEVPMFFHTLVEFVATILIVLIVSGSVISAMYLKLRAKEREDQLDLRDAEAHLGAVEARLHTLEARLGTMESAIGALAAGLTLSPAPQALDRAARTSPTAAAPENAAAQVV
jgi:hypothetical protein